MSSSIKILASFSEKLLRALPFFCVTYTST
uniref:Uncharacterized protein n=1 Tax=Myoviridae sp. ctCo31 TaxID=2825053 RepID=A0A8S5UMJ0_9CAUD|nr:MAG TPA: hypothetical protein [Myoviridae sp. ctCo31]